jgi:hypothetical protein
LRLDNEGVVTLCYEPADDFFDLYDGYTTNGEVQDHGLVSKNVARISFAHNAPVGTLDKVATEMNAAISALFTKRTKLDSDNTKRHWQSERQAKALNPSVRAAVLVPLQHDICRCLTKGREDQ